MLELAKLIIARGGWEAMLFQRGREAERAAKQERGEKNTIYPLKT